MQQYTIMGSNALGDNCCHGRGLPARRWHIHEAATLQWVSTRLATVVAMAVAPLHTLKHGKLHVLAESYMS
jgi:hypothetical protein